MEPYDAEFRGKVLAACDTNDERRAAWRDSQELIDPARVVFIDETWVKTNMTRTYARSELSTRLLLAKPRSQASIAIGVGHVLATCGISSNTLSPIPIPSRLLGNVPS